MEYLSFIAQNLFPILGAIHAVILALIGLFMLIPGEQPEKSLQAVASFLGKFSKK